MLCRAKQIPSFLSSLIISKCWGNLNPVPGTLTIQLSIYCMFYVNQNESSKHSIIFIKTSSSNLLTLTEWKHQELYPYRIDDWWQNIIQWISSLQSPTANFLGKVSAYLDLMNSYACWTVSNLYKLSYGELFILSNIKISLCESQHMTPEFTMI